MLDRYRRLSFDQLFDTPSPASVLFAWSQGGDPDGPRDLLTPHLANDDAVLRIAEALANQVHSSDRGTYVQLRPDSVSPFVPYELLLERISRLADAEGNTPEIKRARALMKAFPEDASDRKLVPKSA